jgi:ferredoxin
VKVSVDSMKCQGFGICAQHLPQVFKLDENGYASAEGDGSVPSGREQDAQNAIADCPTQAIRATE